MTYGNPAILGAALALSIAASSDSQALEIPRLSGWVVDQAGILHNVERLELETEIVVISKNRGGENHPQIAILIPKTLEGYTIADYASQVFKAWKLGEKGKDNGVLLVLAPQELKARIEVGYGLEGALPDSKVNEIMAKNAQFLRPKGKEQWFKFLGSTITEIAKLIKGE